MHMLYVCGTGFPERLGDLGIGRYFAGYSVFIQQIQLPQLC